MLTIWRDLICVAFVCRYLICCHADNSREYVYFREDSLYESFKF